MKVTGIAISNGNISLCETDASKEGLSVTKYDNVSFDTLTQEVCTRVRSLFIKRKYPKKAVVSIPTSDIFIRDIYLPYLDKAKIDMVYRGEVAATIYEHEEKDLITDYVIHNTTSDGTNLIAMAIPAGTLEKYIDLCDKLRIRPDAIEVEIISLFNLLAANGLREDDSGGLLMHFTGTALSMLLVSKGRIVSFRSLPFNYAAFSQCVSQHPASAGSQPPQSGWTGQNKLTDLITVESSRLCAAYPEVETKWLIVVAPDNRNEIQDLLSRHLGLTQGAPVSLDKINNQTSSEVWSLAVPLGAAVRCSGDSGVNVNLFSGKFASEEISHGTKKAASFTFQILIVVMFTYLLKLYFMDLRSYEDAIYNEKTGIYAMQKTLLSNFARDFGITDKGVKDTPEGEAYAAFEKLYMQQKNKYGAGYPIEIDVFPLLTQVYAALRDLSLSMPEGESPDPVEILRLLSLTFTVEGINNDTVKTTIVYETRSKQHGDIFDKALKRRFELEFSRTNDEMPRDGWYKHTREILITHAKKGKK